MINTQFKSFRRVKIIGLFVFVKIYPILKYIAYTVKVAKYRNIQDWTMLWVNDKIILNKKQLKIAIQYFLLFLRDKKCFLRKD